jgi:UDP-N-acetylmuramyl pentapeptide phosphotransferase/UDP-N-acetylglucosamine-1-phosphate transferase
MPYVISTAILFMALLLYFKVADHFNIIDKPNERSSHTEVTIRGGGIVFPLGLICYTLAFGGVSLILIAGALLISLISFLDDIYTLPNRTRLLVQLLAVATIIYAAGGFWVWPQWLIPIVFILVIGCINAYNFMDGINGITGLYSFVAFGSLLYVNNTLHILDPAFMALGMLACLVFLYFNFRNQAKCFAGDVGSVGLAFWIISIIVLLISATGNFKYMLFLSVYGVDAILTIIHRLMLGQNIFDAHRLHLYQILANEGRIPQLYISALYASVQCLLNLMIIFTDIDFYLLFCLINIPLSVLYIGLKSKFFNNQPMSY